MQRKDKADRLPQSRRKRDSDQSFLPETPQNERAGNPQKGVGPRSKPCRAHFGEFHFVRGT